MSNDHDVKEVTIDISNRLQSFVSEVIPVDERLMQLKLKHCLGFKSIVAVLCSY